MYWLLGLLLLSIAYVLSRKMRHYLHMTLFHIVYNLLRLFIWIEGTFGEPEYTPAPQTSHSKVRHYLLRALELMDSTATYYNNEDEANRELVTSLKSQRINAVYHFNLGQGRVADAKVGENYIIEGKLSPSSGEIDRLLGQIQGYSKYPYHLFVVFYGFVDTYTVERIQQETNRRYPNMVSIVYLDSPKRTRKMKPVSVVS